MIGGHYVADELGSDATTGYRWRALAQLCNCLRHQRTSVLEYLDPLTLICLEEEVPFFFRCALFVSAHSDHVIVRNNAAETFETQSSETLLASVVIWPALDHCQGSPIRRIELKDPFVFRSRSCHMTIPNGPQASEDLFPKGRLGDPTLG
jgi:hypothetical protein